MKKVIVNTDGVMEVIGDMSNITELPENLQAIVNTFIDKLDPILQMVLKVASAIGRRFTASLLKIIFPIKKKIMEIDSYLDTLCRFFYIFFFFI